MEITINEAIDMLIAAYEQNLDLAKVKQDLVNERRSYLHSLSADRLMDLFLFDYNWLDGKRRYGEFNIKTILVLPDSLEPLTE